MLTPQQQTHFEVFGFLVMRQAFSPSEIAAITRDFEEVLDEDREGQQFKGDKRQAVIGFAEQRPALMQLIQHDKVYGVVEDLLGPNFVWIGSDGNLYVGDTHWHPDTPVTGYRRLKVAFYLDPVTRDTGALRVVPGSHLPGLHDKLTEHRPAIEADSSPYGIPDSEIPSYPLESQPGDVVFFNQNLWHAAFGGRTGRRMFTFNFGAQPRQEADFENLRRTYQVNLRHTEEAQKTHTGRVYTDSFLQSDSPRIKRMVGPLVEMGLK